MRKAKNQMILRFPSLSVNEQIARSAVAAFVTQGNPTVSEISDIKCAVSEAVTNAVVHAYRDTVGMIYITAQYFEDRTVRIEISDKGCGITDIETAMEPLYTGDRSGERSGMGFAVMQSFMDDLKVTSTVGGGVKVVMSKKLGEE